MKNLLIMLETLKNYLQATFDFSDVSFFLDGINQTNTLEKVALLTYQNNENIGSPIAVRSRVALYLNLDTNEKTISLLRNIKNHNDEFLTYSDSNFDLLKVSGFGEIKAVSFALNRQRNNLRTYSLEFDIFYIDNKIQKRF